MILLYANDSSSILFIGVYFKYFQGFSTCIPRLFSIVLFLADKRLQASLLGVFIFCIPFPPLVNKLCATYILPDPFLLKNGAR